MRSNIHKSILSFVLAWVLLSPVAFASMDLASSRVPKIRRELVTLASPVLVEDTVVLEKGARVRGRIVEAADSGRIRGRASIEMTLTDILTDGGTITIQTQPFAEEAESDTAPDAKIGAAGAAVGALIGGLPGGKKGAIAGAAAGAAGAVVATKGKELSYPSESRMTFKLSANVRVVPTRF